MEEFLKLRERIFNQIKKALEEDGHHKSYEGCMRLGQDFSGYFEEGEPTWFLCLDCYVIGPGRHYEWQGETLAEVVQKAHKTIDVWEAAENINE